MPFIVLIIHKKYYIFIKQYKFLSLSFNSKNIHLNKLYQEKTENNKNNTYKSTGKV